MVRLEVPPLRDRRDDIPLLVEHFRKQFSAAMNKEIVGVSSGALDVLAAYPWEGNVRELENCMERAFVVCRGDEIEPRHLPPEVRQGRPPLARGAAPVEALAGAEAHNAADRPASSGSARKPLSRGEIEAVLQQTDWNVAKSAKKLGVARNTLYLKMRNLGLSRPEDD